MARHRSFGSEFRRQVSRELLEGRAGMHELARRYSLSRNLIRLWVRKYEAGEFTDELAEAVQIAEYERKIAELERKVGQLTMEVDLLKKGAATGTRRERRELLDRERPKALAVAQGRRLMKLARSTYYYRSDRQTTVRNALEKRIALLCAEFPRYGYRRITAQLRTEGMKVNHKAVARVMRDQELQVRPLRRFVRTTDSQHDSPIFPNRARGFIPTAADQLWVSDITYIAIAHGFVYLAVILDAWSRRVVGYALGRQIDTRLTLAALRAAIHARHPRAGLIHHSDRGTQYAATLSERTGRAWAGGLDGTTRQSVRQRQGRELHEDAQVRGGLPQRLPEPRGGGRAASSLHR